MPAPLWTGSARRYDRDAGPPRPRLVPLEPGQRLLDAHPARIAPPDAVQEIVGSERGADLDDVAGAEAYHHRGGGLRPGADGVVDRRQRLDGAAAELVAVP